MGLEGLDLLLESEKTFGITITDAEASVVRTPREFIDLVASKVHAAPATDRRVQELYFDLRRGFRAALAGQPAPRLDDPLPEMLVAADWPRIWSDVRSASGRSDLPEKMGRPGSFWSAGVRTLRDLVWSLAIDLAPTIPVGEAWTREEVAVRVRALIVEQGRSPSGFDENRTWREIGWP
jgi:hypothetical protein